MSIWLNYTDDEKLVLLQQTAKAKKIAAEQAIEKDWWVSAVLVALSKTSWADVLQFKGGTSLSKAWGLISRFSEDIDLAINRSFFHLPEESVDWDSTENLYIEGDNLEVLKPLSTIWKPRPFGKKYGPTQSTHGQRRK